ncbi:MAG: peptidoglycan-binding protein [Nitrospira sp.]|nr:peptidoglycan-binding protein [Nitrospira sp.]
MTLRKGNRGEKVKVLQQALNAHGFALEDDGIFGVGTERAVKTFQRQNGLKADGIVGEKTFGALGLEAGTLEPRPDVITFEPEDVDVPTPVSKAIRDLVEKSVAARRQLLETTLNALDQFETTMQHASVAEASPDVLGVLVSQAIDKAVGEMIDHLPGLAELKSIYDTVTGELARAGKARQSLAMGDWIKDQRAVIDGEMHKVDHEEIISELELRYLELDQQDRAKFFDGVVNDSQRVASSNLPHIDELECRFYEEWINAHFIGIFKNAPGCIEFRHNYDEGDFTFVSCTVNAPSGDKVESAINRLLDRAHVSWARRPIDLNVRKCGTFWVDNFVPGGKSWSTGWLDSDDKNIHSPPHPVAVEAFNDQRWRSVGRFKRD